MLYYKIQWEGATATAVRRHLEKNDVKIVHPIYEDHMFAVKGQLTAFQIRELVWEVNSGLWCNVKLCTEDELLVVQWFEL